MNTENVMMSKIKNFHELSEENLQHVTGGEDQLVFLPDGKVITGDEDIP